jgi:hypothetical protein
MGSSRSSSFDISEANMTKTNHPYHHNNQPLRANHNLHRHRHRLHLRPARHIFVISFCDNNNFKYLCGFQINLNV